MNYRFKNANPDLGHIDHEQLVFPVQRKKIYLSSIIKQKVNKNEKFIALNSHGIFQKFKSCRLSKTKITYLAGQMWHSTHYFTTFLANAISKQQDLACRSFLSSILYQELGSGDPLNAHENIFLDSLEGIGINTSTVINSAMNQSTSCLISGYQIAGEDKTKSIGYMLGTELADLQIVSSLGAAFAKYSGQISFPWIDIHVLQEPSHVRNAILGILSGHAQNEIDNSFDSANELWKLWIDFFSELEMRLF